MIGGIAYFAVKRNNNSTTVHHGHRPARPVVGGGRRALAASINLRLDRPARPGGPGAPPRRRRRGRRWHRPPPRPRPTRPLAVVPGPTVPAWWPGCSARPPCPGRPAAVQLADLPERGRSGIADGLADTVMAQHGRQLRPWTRPFANPNFATCFGQYQSALVGGGRARVHRHVQPVTLPAPAGVTVLRRT